MYYLMMVVNYCLCCQVHIGNFVILCCQIIIIFLTLYIVGKQFLESLQSSLFL